MWIMQLNSENGIGIGELYRILLKIESQWHPSMADNVEDLKKYAEKIYINAFVFGVVRDSEIIGLAAIYANDISGGQAYLTYIGLCEEYTSKGQGTSLLAFCEKTAKENQMETMMLEVKKTNKRALSFYRKNGYNFVNENREGTSFYMDKKI